MGTTAHDPLIGIVGPCGAGKTSLAAKLSSHYTHVRAIAQEHSYVQDMWHRITNPDILIYLDASYPVTIQRRQLNWTEEEYHIELKRLADAHEHADIYIATDQLSLDNVFQVALEKLKKLVSSTRE
ncbi:MAG: hypothetical protein WCF08_06855 [Anaerolineaceae bacterium]